ncbi:MAG: hypothetical protein Q8920_04490 [Bacillota bacterium]|nr:hypothetical protein [Bacillota bacterium]
MGQPEERFWNSTLRQIYLLLDEHKRAKTPPEEQEVYIDQI